MSRANKTRVYPEITIAFGEGSYSVSFDGQCVGTADIACAGGGLELLADEDLSAAITAAAEDPRFVCDERMLRTEIIEIIDAA